MEEGIRQGGYFWNDQAMEDAVQSSAGCCRFAASFESALMLLASISPWNDPHLEHEGPAI